MKKPAVERLLLKIIVFAVVGYAGSQGAQAIEREGAAVCRGESIYFANLRGQTGTPDPTRAEAVRGARVTELMLSDGGVLRGFQIKVPAPVGFILYAPGNGMRADQILPFLEELSGGHYNIYVYDWRGLGMSPGKTSLRDIFADYEEVLRYVISREPGQRVLYAVSFGGVALLNALPSDTRFDALVIDSTPSELPFLCSSKYHPKTHLPADCSRVLVISGQADRVVRPRTMEELITIAKKRGGSVATPADLSHPGVDLSSDSRIRIPIIRNFLAKKTNAAR